MFRSTFWMAMCIFLQKCEVGRVILNLVAFKKYPNSIWLRYMVQLRLDNCTLVGRQLVICDTMFGFWLGDGFNPDYFFIDKINYKVSIENHRPTLKDSFLSCIQPYGHAQRKQINNIFISLPTFVKKIRQIHLVNVIF